MNKSELDKLEERAKEGAKLKSEKNKLEDQKESLEKTKERLSSQIVRVNKQKFQIDFFGGMSAQAIVELENWAIRALANYAAGDQPEKSWLWRNQDVLQGAVNTGTGAIIYLLSIILTSTDGARLPSGWALFATKIGEIAGNLGFNNLFNAIRVRLSEGKEQRQIGEAERKALQQEVQELRSALAAAKGSK